MTTDRQVFPLLTERELLSFSTVSGVDRLSLSFPVRRASARYEDWNGGESRRLTGATVDIETGEINSPTMVTRSARVEVEGLQVFVGTSYRPETGATHGKLEFNPSRLLVKGVASVREAVTVAHSIFNSDQVQALVEASCKFDDAKLKRVDVTRDFTVDSVGGTIDGLEKIPRPYARKVSRFSDPQNGQAQTLTVGNATSSARLYDKHQQDPTYSPNTLRFEIAARSGGSWLDNIGGMKTMGDLNSENVGQLAADRWQWGSFGAEIVAGRDLFARLDRAGLSAARQRAFVGYLYMQQQGIDPQMGSRALASYRKLQRQLGVTLDSRSGSGLTVVKRLDYATGTEVMRVA